MKYKKEKFTVIAQGGGIMTAYNAGVIQALVELGTLSRVKRICGVSGAAATWTYVASGQTSLITPLWTELIACGRFINFKRWPPLHGVMNIDVLIDEFVKDQFHLDLEALRNSPIRLEVCATHAVTGKGVWFCPRYVRDFPEVLRATCAVPYFFGKSVQVYGQFFYDGGIAKTTGTEELNPKNKTLVVLTRPWDHKVGLPMTIRRLSRWLLIRKESPALQEAIFTAPERRAREMSRLADLVARYGPSRLCVLAPSNKLPTIRIDPRLSALKATIEQGYRETMAYAPLRTFLND